MPIIRVIFCLLLLLPVASAQHPFYKFDSFDKAAGLSKSTRCIDQDEDGFFWLGTDGEGLYRFDGVQALKINYPVNDSVPGSWLSIFMLSCDTIHDLIWLATSSGIVRYDKRTRQSKLLLAKELLPGEEIIRASAHVIYTDRQGNTWADFGRHGLTGISPDGKTVTNYILPLSEEEIKEGRDERMANSVTFIRQDIRDDDILWLATRKGLIKFQKSSKKLERFFYTPERANMFGLSNAMMYLYCHPDGNIYIATWNGGMLIFDPVSRSFSRYFLSPDGWSDVSEKNQVNTILPDGNGNLWISGSGGVYHFDIKNLRFSPSLSEAHLHFKDRDANYWQFWGGLRLFHHDKNQQIMKRVEAPCKPIISGVPINKKEGIIYLRTHCEGGLYGMDIDDQSWRFYPLPGRSGEEVEGKGYCETPNGFLYSDEKNRLYWKANGAPNFQYLPITFPENVGNLTIRCRDDGEIFISGVDGWLFRLKEGIWEMKSWYKTQVNEPYPDHFMGVGVSLFDKWGRLWLFTFGGFSIFDPEKNSFIHVSKRQKNVRHLQNYFNFMADHQGRIWANGSCEIGWIDPLHPEQGVQQVYDKTKGFSYDKIGFSFIDNKKFWLSTDKGLVQFDPETGHHKLFEHFKTWNIAHLQEGKIIAFFDYKYTIQDITKIRRNEEVPQPYIAWFKVFEKSFTITGNIFSPQKINLKPGDNFFSIGFSAQALYDPDKIRFAYQLEGVDRDWIYPEPGIHAVSYTNIHGGDYTFKVKTTNSRGEWAETPFLLQIHVGTPWYKTRIAFLVYLLLLGGIVYAGWLFQKRRWQLQTDLKWQSQEAARLAELDAFKTRFFTNITHEFRTPLTVIMGISQELANETPLQLPESEERKTQLLTVHRNGAQLLDLVNQMLDLAKIEAGSLSLQPGQADIMAFIRITVESFHSLAVSKKQNLACFVQPDTFLMDFDPQQFQKIIGNLVSNALKFTPEYGTVKVNAKVIENNQLTIEVADTGPGIAADDLDRIFDRFYQSGASTDRTWEGTGIGLALVQELLLMMNGKIQVTSVPGEGAIFKIILPVTNKAPLLSPIPIPPANGSSNTIPANGIQPEGEAQLPILLHIEDNADLIRYLDSLLRGQYRLITARNGKEGLDKALEYIPDIILSDVMMPEMNGYELCEKIKADLRSSHIPVVLLTAKAALQDKIEGLQYGADAYLMKPFNKEELFVTLQNLLENRRRLVAFLNANHQDIEDKNMPAIANSSQAITPAIAKEHEFLLKVRTVIDRHLEDESYDMERLSQDLSMSRMQVYRKLTALTGKSASHFVRSHRLQKAKELLETTDLTAAEIAYQTGFSDPAYFSKCFKEAFGYTPGKKRK